jgi:hypothetical protein
MPEIDKLKTLAKGVRALSPDFEIRLVASKDNMEHWAVLVSVSGIVLIDTDFGMLENVLDMAVSKLANLSQRTLNAVRPKPGDPDLK